MNIQIVSLFPEMFAAISDFGVSGKAISNGVANIDVINPREFAEDQRKTVDDRPYGGGPGMVMMAQPLLQAVAKAKSNAPNAKVVYLSPQGEKFGHAMAQTFVQRSEIIFLCGRYEGVDERAIESVVDEEVSIGDYVLSGGELAVMVIVDAITRLLPKGLGNAESAVQDSFAAGLLDYPHYTRPEQLNGLAVPKVLLSGDHQAIENWRMKQALGRTWLRRPELLSKIELTVQQQQLLDEFKQEQ